MRAEKFEHVADLTLEAKALAAAQLRAAVQRREIPPAKLASILKDASVSAGIDVDKGLLLRGQPTAISERRSPEELLRKLEGLGVKLGAIEGEAEEIPAPALEEPR